MLCIAINRLMPKISISRKAMPPNDMINIPRTRKMAPFYWRYFHNHLFAYQQWTDIGSDKGLAPNRRQAIIWTDDWLVYLRTYASLGLITYCFQSKMAAILRATFTNARPWQECWTNKSKMTQFAGIRLCHQAPWVHRKVYVVYKAKHKAGWVPGSPFTNMV